MDDLARSPQPENAQSETAVHSGSLGVRGKTRYGVLFEDRFEVYKNEREARSGVEPRGNVRMTDVVSGTVFRDASGQPTAIHLNLEDSKVELDAGGSGNLSIWVEAFSKLVPSIEEKDSAAEQKKMVDREQAPDCEGLLGMVRKGKIIERYFVIQDGAIDNYDSVTDWKSGANPRARLLLADIEKIDVDGTSGITIHSRDARKPLDLRMLEDSDIESWLRVLRPKGALEAREAPPSSNDDPAPSEDETGWGEAEAELAGDGHQDAACNGDGTVVDAHRAVKHGGKPMQPVAEPEREVEPGSPCATDRGHLTPPPSTSDSGLASPTVTPSATKVFHEGQVHVFIKGRVHARGQQYKAQHLVLARLGNEGCWLQLYDTKEAKDRDEAHVAPIEVGDDSAFPTAIAVDTIQSFNVMENGFVLGAGKRTIRLRVAEKDEWVEAFHAMFQAETEIQRQQELTSDRQARGDRVQHPPSSPGRRLNGGKRVSYSGEEQLSMATSTEGAVATTKSSPSLLDWPLRDLQHPNFTKWLSQLHLIEPYLHQGLLGMNHNHRNVTGFVVLFKDRLDYWTRPFEATVGKRPCGSFHLPGVWTFEMVPNGFILDCKGRKIGFHTRTNEDLHEWHVALVSALAPAGGHNVDTDGDKAYAASPSKSPGRRQRVEHLRSSEQLSSRSQRSDTRPASWYPRVADLKKKTDPDESATNSPRQKSRFDEPSAGTSFVVSTSPRLRQDNGFRLAKQSVASKVSASTDEGKIETTKDSVAKEVTDKVTNSNRVFDRPQPPGSCPWTKVNHTSQSSISDPVRHRYIKERKEEKCEKICGEEKHLRRPNNFLTDKLTDHDRQPICRKRTEPWSVQQKITDTGRCGASSPLPSRKTDVDNWPHGQAVRGLG